MKPLKDWIPFNQQLQKLQERGLQVDNTQAALNYLKRLGYYRLRGYWYPLRAIDVQASQAQGKAVRLDTFEAGKCFKDVVDLYVFDKKLRLLALDALERIEMAVRVEVAFLLGERDPLAHKKVNCLHGNFTKKKLKNGPNKGKTQHDIWLEKYNSLVNRARNDPFVKHHMQHYGDLPIWAAIEVWDFGQLSKLFAGMKKTDQDAIATTYGAYDGSEFAKWLRSLNFIRNVSAHHSRLWNINILELSPIPVGWPVSIKNSRPFFYFCLMQQLLKVICPNSSWGQRFTQLLEHEFPDAFSLAEFGVFAGWDTLPIWKQKT